MLREELVLVFFFIFSSTFLYFLVFLFYYSISLGSEKVTRDGVMERAYAVNFLFFLKPTDQNYEEMKETTVWPRERGVFAATNLENPGEMGTVSCFILGVDRLRERRRGAVFLQERRRSAARNRATERERRRGFCFSFLNCRESGETFWFLLGVSVLLRNETEEEMKSFSIVYCCCKTRNRERETQKK
jgi:hypothetical protein